MRCFISYMYQYSNGFSMETNFDYEELFVPDSIKSIADINSIEELLRNKLIDRLIGIPKKSLRIKILSWNKFDEYK